MLQRPKRKSGYWIWIEYIFTLDQTKRTILQKLITWVPTKNYSCIRNGTNIIFEELNSDFRHFFFRLLRT